MGKKKNGLIIASVIFILVLLIFLIVGVSKGKVEQSSYPDDIPLYPNRFPLILEYNLNEGTNNINLNEGLKLDTIYLVEYFSKGCSDKFVQKGSMGKTENIGSSETINFNGKNYDISYSSCESLVYGDEQFSENQYQHYEERKIRLTSSMSNNNLIILVNKDDINSIGRKLILYLQVSCTRDSQCQKIQINDELLQPICSIYTNECTLKNEENFIGKGDQPDIRLPVEPEKLNIWEILMYGAILGIIISLLFYFLYTKIFYKKKR